MNYSQDLIRIMSDIIEFNKSPIKDIYINPDKEDIHKIKAMIIGPKTTPYENGYFFFDIKMPSNYPKSSPTVKFETIDGKVRFNPNLYQKGKVCLSILGTWSGPGWKPTMTLSSVLLSIQSLLSEQPIVNEPGYEKVKWNENISLEYNNYISFHTYRLAILEVLKNKFKNYSCFSEDIKTHFKNNKDNILNNLKSYSVTIGEKIILGEIYFLPKNFNIDFTKLLNQFNYFLKNDKNISL